MIEIKNIGTDLQNTIMDNYSIGERDYETYIGNEYMTDYEVDYEYKYDDDLELEQDNIKNDIIYDFANEIEYYELEDFKFIIYKNINNLIKAKCKITVTENEMFSDR